MKHIIVLFGVWAVSCFGANQQRIPVVYDVTGLAVGVGGLNAAGGKWVQFSSGWSSPGARILFEDLVPGANWGHPGKYKVVDANGKVLEEIPTRLPPIGLDSAPVVSQQKRDKKLPVVEFKLDDYHGSMKVAEPAKYYALLINGMAGQRHWNDFSFLYRVLVQIYGYLPSNIFVADGVFKDSSPDLEGKGETNIKYTSTMASVRDLMGMLKDKLKETDHLLIAVNDHGGSIDGESTIVLLDGEMKSSEFGTMLQALPTKRVLSIYEQCFSGGFVRPSITPTAASMAAAHNGEFSWATADLVWDEFIYHVIAAFAKQTHDGKPLPTDLNGDGKVSAQEAFAWAIGRDQAAESPLLEAARNAGTSAQIGLGF